MGAPLLPWGWVANVGSTPWSIPTSAPGVLLSWPQPGVGLGCDCRQPLSVVNLTPCGYWAWTGAFTPVFLALSGHLPSAAVRSPRKQGVPGKHHIIPCLQAVTCAVLSVPRQPCSAELRGHSPGPFPPLEGFITQTPLPSPPATCIPPAL